TLPLSASNRGMKMRGQTDQIKIANPTIAEVLAQFLEEQKARVSPRTFTQYRSVVQLLQHCLNTYAYQALDKTQARLFDRLNSLEGREHGEFCEIFGPEYILPNVDEFLGRFMIRKVMAGKDLLRAAGTVTTKLARWLGRKGYAPAEDVQ